MTGAPERRAWAGGRQSAHFRLHLDATRCDGHGICALVCPDLVRLDPWGYASVVETDGEAGRVLRRARRAVAMCPAGALRLDVLAAEP